MINKNQISEKKNSEIININRHMPIMLEEKIWCLNNEIFNENRQTKEEVTIKNAAKRICNEPDIFLILLI